MLFGRKAKIRVLDVDEPLTMPPPEPETSEVPDAGLPEDGGKAFSEEPQTSETALLDEEEKDMRETDLTASVSRDTVINGDIVTDNNIDIFGKVEGSLQCSAVVKAYGTVKGNISCAVLVANGASIVGDVTSENSVVLGTGTSMKGNIRTGIVNISGKIDGNIYASESITITSTGAVAGDITTPVIEVSKGAAVSGTVAMIAPVEKPAEIQQEEPQAEVFSETEPSEPTETALEYTEQPDE